MRYVRVALLAAGVALLAALIVQNDPAAIAASIGRLSWRLGVIVCFPVSLVVLFDTLGWRFAFLRDVVAFRTLVPARMAGEAFNVTTPAAVSGDAIKAWLLRDRTPLHETVPSVIIAKTTITIAQGLFLLVGIVLAWQTPFQGTPLQHAMQWLFVVEIVILGGFVAAQVGGVIGWSGRMLSKLLPVPALVEGEGLTRVNDALARFYRREPVRFLLSTFYHFVGWLLGALETYLILHFLGVPASLLTCTVIEAFGAAIRIAAFLIPASLGAVESGFVVTFVGLGLDATTGLSFALVRRLREAVWTGLGLLAFALMRPTTPLR